MKKKFDIVIHCIQREKKSLKVAEFCGVITRMTP